MDNAQYNFSAGKIVIISYFTLGKAHSVIKYSGFNDCMQFQGLFCF
jgi:hypothetical protein